MAAENRYSLYDFLRYYPVVSGDFGGTAEISEP